jgi:hypothetical protein
MVCGLLNHAIVRLTSSISVAFDLLISDPSVVRELMVYLKSHIISIDIIFEVNWFHNIVPNFQNVVGVRVWVWGGRAKRPLHRDHFMICCAFPIFTIPPVVLCLVYSNIYNYSVSLFLKLMLFSYCILHPFICECVYFLQVKHFICTINADKNAFDLWYNDRPTFRR